MKGSTHLAIGAAIGAASTLYYPFHPNHGAVYMLVASFSALAADLDGPSLLSGKLGKLSRWLRGFALWSGILLVIANAYWFVFEDWFSFQYSSIAVVVLLLSLVTSQGTIRNALVSIVGLGLMYAGLRSGQAWLMELGGFVAWVPWLKHRGMTHTVWALLIWGTIGWGLEKQIGIPGVTATAVAGYASHLLADMLTPNGVKWLSPLYKKSFKFIPR
ncbi:metal-dependent hydrolase [Paenibacillus antri]|uniref:Metal-dependent hydrolase n=1 Tax=Paenibacillus antri TaxID=2582848 RepID=A0A5R9GL03_9BACL|nr:metal-dependent hydrolase [Paenibacillus antri]TLS52435.1 metal-dependent hydrolase [Paenibacillus antri]